MHQAIGIHAPPTMFGCGIFGKTVCFSLPHPLFLGFCFGFFLERRNAAAAAAAAAAAGHSHRAGCCRCGTAARWRGEVAHWRRKGRRVFSTRCDSVSYVNMGDRCLVWRKRRF